MVDISISHQGSGGSRRHDDGGGVTPDAAETKQRKTSIWHELWVLAFIPLMSRYVRKKVVKPCNMTDHLHTHILGGKFTIY